jgi:hypothetical protein
MTFQPDLLGINSNELIKLDIRAVANMILDRTLILSKAVNIELLKPISKWIDDPDFLNKYEKIFEDKVVWSRYKRKQREWTKQQKQIEAARLRLYWQEMRRQKNLRRDLSRLFAKSILSINCENESESEMNVDFLTKLLSPFSPKELKRAELLQEFKQSRTLTAVNKLPWKVLLSNQIKTTMDLTELEIYYPENTKADITAKLLHLLQMDTDGEITLNQDEPFGPISIAPHAIDQEGSIIVINDQGESHHFYWNNLTNSQQERIIADIKASKIMCKCS